MKQIITFQCGHSQELYGLGEIRVLTVMDCRECGTLCTVTRVDREYNVARCATCIWDPTTGERHATCRACYEKEGTKRDFHCGQPVMLNCERIEYSRRGVSKSALGVVTQSAHATANDLVRVKFGSFEMWVRAQDIDKADAYAEQRARWAEREVELLGKISKLRCLLGDIWPYVHTNCTIQTLRDRVLAAMKDKP